MFRMIMMESMQILTHASSWTYPIFLPLESNTETNFALDYVDDVDVWSREDAICSHGKLHKGRLANRDAYVIVLTL